MSERDALAAAGERRRAETEGHPLRRWQIALFEAVVTAAVVGAAGFDTWLSEHFARSSHGIVMALRDSADLGNSRWYFVSFGCALFAALILRGLSRRPSRRALFGWSAEAFGYIIAAVAVSGILTNILKTFYGRARPGVLPGEANGDWTMFAFFDWPFQSFPSGHATTMFALVVALALLFPAWRNWFIALGLYGAIARVAASDHFFSDVVAGSAVGGLTAWWLAGWLARRGWVFRSTGGRIMPRRIGGLVLDRLGARGRQHMAGRRHHGRGARLAAAHETRRRVGGLTRLRGLALAIGLLAAPFVLFLPIDPIVASLFYFGDGSFWLTDSFVGDLFHDVLRPLFYWLLVALVVVLAIREFRRRHDYGRLVRKLVYIAAVLGIGIGLVTNLLLKDQWDRPRPLDTVEFGGDERYQPPLLPTEGCIDNCSFVSGDAAAGFATVALAIAFAAGCRRRRWVAVALWFGAVVGLLRIMNGSHYFADVLYAGVVNVWLAAALYLPIMHASPAALRRWSASSRASLGRFAARLRAFARRARHPSPRHGNPAQPLAGEPAE